MLRYLVRNRDSKPKSISWTYVLNLDLCNHEKKSHNWKEHHPDHPYTISSVLHVDGQLYFILSFTEFTGLVFTLITTLLSGEEFVHSFCVYSGVGGFSGTKTIRGHAIRLTGNYSNSSITLDDLNRNAPVHLALFH